MSFPTAHYFMMGDNRDNSTDSRFLNDVGYVPVENFVGRAEIIFFSIEAAAASGSSGAGLRPYAGAACSIWWTDCLDRTPSHSENSPRSSGIGLTTRAIFPGRWFIQATSIRPPASGRRISSAWSFVGDRVLGLVIAELLYAKFPDSDEGGLASRFNMLVRKEACAQVARRSIWAPIF